MKNQNKKETKKISSNKKNNKTNSLVPLFLQAIFSIITLILVIVYFLNESTVGLLQMSLGFTLIIMGYNNYKVYHRPFLTLIYFVVGLLLFSFSIMTIMGI